MPLAPAHKAVMGARSLYLNFINLFMLMLRLAGVRFAPQPVVPACAQKVGCNQLKTVEENVRVNSGRGSRHVCFAPIIGRRTVRGVLPDAFIYPGGRAPGAPARGCRIKEQLRPGRSRETQRRFSKELWI